MDLLYTFLSLFGCGLVWLMPTALAAAALVDMLRVRAEWYWCFIIFGIPFFGPLAYFAINYLPIFGVSQAVSTLSPTAYRRTQAKRRLKELQIQMQHWRGPAVLAEAGEQLLDLGKLKQAEELLREAQQADADIKDVNFHLAQVLQVRAKRWSEALPLLEELVELEPDARFGAARLALARCLDESGHAERAEEELRAVLKKRSPPEGKVRLARLLLARGEGQEATELLAEVRADAATLPKYLVNEHKPWIRQAGKLKSKDTKLPAPKLEGVPPRRSPVFLTAVVVGGLVLVLALVSVVRLYLWPMFSVFGSMGDQVAIFDSIEQSQERFQRLDRRLPERINPGDPDSVTGALPAFLEFRREVAAGCEPMAQAREEQQRLVDEMHASDSWSGGWDFARKISSWHEARAEFAASLATAMETHEISPSNVDRLLTLVDGQFLERHAARILLVPEHFRSDYALAFAELAEPLPPRSEPEWRRQVQASQADARAKLEDLDRMAERDISDEIVALLEPLRQELDESLPERCLAPILQMLEPDLAWMDLPEPEHPLIEH